MTDLRGIAPCYKCGKFMDCNCTLEDVKAHIMKQVKNKMKDGSTHTDLAQRIRNKLLAKEIGFVERPGKPDLLNMLDEFNGRPVSIVIDYRQDRKNPKPIEGVVWGSYQDAEKGYLSYQEINELDIVNLYKERYLADEEPEEAPAYIEVDGIKTITGDVNEGINDFDMVKEEVVEGNKTLNNFPEKKTETKKEAEVVEAEFVRHELVPTKIITNETTSPVPVSSVGSGIVTLAVTPEEFKSNWDNYTKFRDSIQTEDDRQKIGDKHYLKKSYWRKVATAFNLTDEIVSEERIDVKDGFIWKMKVRALAPNGRSAEGVGMCDSRERKYAHVEHDVYATAHTRAKNRAISDLVGGGEVSADEMQ